MPVIQHNPDGVYPPYRNYSHATEIRGDHRLLIISGVNAYLADGKSIPETFEEQAELVWQHIGTILRAAEMSYSNLVSVRVYLASSLDREANTRIRAKYLGEHRPSLTVVACELLDPQWKLEIEAMAAAG